jgi:hypothetical protein
MALWDKDTTPEQYKKIGDDIRKYNMRYPQEDRQITDDVLDRSEKSFNNVRENMMYGTEIKDEDIPYAQWYYLNRGKPKK